MKFQGKDKKQVTLICKYIESLGGELIKECPGGSIYYKLNHIERIRISDHIGLKCNIYNFDIILKDNKFLCIYYRDFIMFETIDEVKLFISNMNFSINTFYHHLENTTGDEIKTLRKESNSRQNKIEQLQKENKKLKSELEKSNQAIAKRDRQLEDKMNKLTKMTEYHNRCQELESQLNKLLKADKVKTDELENDNGVNID